MKHGWIEFEVIHYFYSGLGIFENVSGTSVEASKCAAESLFLHTYRKQLG